MRWLKRLLPALLLSTFMLTPAARAEQVVGQSAPTEAPALIDDTFQAPDALLQATPVVDDEPAVPAGTALPSADAGIIVAVLLAAAGGFVAGVFVGVVGCCLLYYTGFY
jgi:hypothetical protein